MEAACTFSGLLSATRDDEEGSKPMIYTVDKSGIVTIIKPWGK